MRGLKKSKSTLALLAESLSRTKKGSNSGGSRRKNKYSAKAKAVDGIQFASKAEAIRYGQLRFLEMAKAIRDLELQPHFDYVVNGKKIARGYTADFKYFDIGTGKWIVEDVKGFAARDWPLRRDLFIALYGTIYQLKVIKI
jgi:hypothetical protein